MNLMKTYYDQITIFYNPEINKHKKTIAHAKSVGKILAMPFKDMPEAFNIWATIWKGLREDPMQVFDKNDPKFEKLAKESVIDFESWRKIAVNNLELFHSPIAIKGKQVVVCDRQTKIYELIEEAN